MEANPGEHKRWNDHGWTAHWPKRERFTETVTPLLLEALALKPGERVLEIGSGGGIATLAAAKIIGAQGAVVGADISAPLAALAARRAAETGASNVSFVVKDAQTDRIPGAPFNVAMSQFGVMFFDEPVTAFANIRAHLVSGGRLGFACWQEPAKNPWFYGPALADLVPPPPPPLAGKSPTGPFALADAGRVREILERAGFVAVSFATREYTVDVAEDSVTDDAQLVFVGVPAEKMPQARLVVDRHMAAFRLPSGLCRFPLAIQVVTARNPVS